ncbi:fibronectin type III domain-containing protein [Abyssalbus ytuae]|uniref:Fibronectin type-III domain-containing protein n=1 Tax=Abyssalbus ytuae TaxID=2926907 RepID=A0A9E6ZSJ1_9FLAO|nr:hypothetical protein [Abyssalbus ytuae]UOB17068.1 hypothetical protein MQE35_15170 [Abyssalbus ytuae]
MILVFPLKLKAQNTPPAEEETVKIIVKARAKEGKVMLRWGVNEKYAWKYGNTYGYSIERVTILRDGKPLLKPERKILTGGPVKPKPLQEWESIASTNDMAAVAAQAIYGEDFEVNDEENSSPVMQVVLESEELDRRFGFSMFAIDQDFTAAQYAGLGLVDTDVKTNEKYLYNIKSAIPEDLMKIEPSGIFISPSEEEELPKPVDFAGYYYNNAFVLVWEYDLLQEYYTSYDLQRSEDGITFKTLNKTPITKLADTGFSGISYTDSIPQFGKNYWYRITGRSLFDEKSEPSEALQLIAFEELQATPVFEENVILSDTEVQLRWSFPEQEAWKVQKFDLLRSDKAVGPYDVVVGDIDAKARNYRYKKLKPVNYFKLKAYGTGGDTQTSPNNMVQPIDSVPPVKPVGLEGTIDSLGLVKLTWAQNNEPDLKGYKIFRADRPGQEFTLLGKYSINKLFYTDTINLRSFNPKVFYKIMAIDHRYNESEYSEVLALNRPDKIPPTSPVFDSYKLSPDGVLLQWTKSSSDDVAREIIYRKNMNTPGTEVWEKVYETQNDTLHRYMDKNVIPGTKYFYTMVAIDNAGLESNPSPPLSVSAIGQLVAQGVKGLYASVDRENKLITLAWRLNITNAHELLLYKKEEGQPYTLYQTIEPDQKLFTDTKLYPNTTYGYGVKVVFKDGSIGGWQEIKVVY